VHRAQLKRLQNEHVERALQQVGYFFHHNKKLKALYPRCSTGESLSPLLSNVKGYDSGSTGRWLQGLSVSVDRAANGRTNPKR
jgi:hypothetical protein